MKQPELSLYTKPPEHFRVCAKHSLNPGYVLTRADGLRFVTRSVWLRCDPGLTAWTDIGTVVDPEGREFDLQQLYPLEFYRMVKYDESGSRHSRMFARLAVL